MNTPALRTLRRNFFQEGEPPSPGQLNEVVARSWQRCIQKGLDPYAKKIPANILPADILKIRQEQRQDLINTVAPSMDYLQSLITGTASVIVLADAQGVIIHSVGDDSFLNKADSVLLKSGASWQEQHRGTNAIGTALTEGRSVSINGAEHYFEQNGFLTCAAAPIRGIDGKILGILDISSDYRAYHPHTLGLVKTTVDHIEKQLMMSLKPAGSVVLTFHSNLQALGTLAEGLLFLDETGTILASNSVASQALSLSPHTSSTQQDIKLSHIININWQAALSQARQKLVQQLECQTFDGRKLFLRLDFSHFKPDLMESSSQFASASSTEVWANVSGTPNTRTAEMSALSANPLRSHTLMAIEACLKQHGGNISQAAKSLGISRTTLYRYIQKNNPEATHVT